MKSQPQRASFLTTRWSVVRRAAASRDEPGAEAALAHLCTACWFPIYAFIRRSGKSAHDAEDLTQGFFARLLEKNVLASADGDKGRLRTFLLTCAQRYLADEHDRDMTQKRGGGRVLELDALAAEERYAAEPIDRLTPDRCYQRRWALDMIDTAMESLRAQHVAEGKLVLFEKLRPYLGFSASAEENYAGTAAALGLPLNTVKSHIRRLREQWRDLLTQQVAATLDEPTPENIKAELAELIAFV